MKAAVVSLGGGTSKTNKSKSRNKKKRLNKTKSKAFIKPTKMFVLKLTKKAK